MTRYTITTLNDNGSGMKFNSFNDFMLELRRMLEDCLENDCTYIHIEADSDASFFMKDSDDI